MSRILALAALVPLLANAESEYSKHFAALSELSVAVAQAMPADQYGFKPHPESMNFGELMSHIAATNYQFCAGMKDTAPPAMPSPYRQGQHHQISQRFVRLLLRRDPRP